MSTQLILYPQSYEGKHSFSQTGSSEWVVDGINFTSINSATQVALPTVAFTGTAKYTEMLTNHPPTPINTWFTFKSGAVPAYPTQVGNKLILDAAPTLSWSGVYQRLNNLTIGAVYTVTVEATGSISAILAKLLIRHIHTSPATASVEILNQGAPILPVTTTYTTTFTAQGTQDGIMVVYEAPLSASIKVEKISVRDTAGTPTLVYADLEDGQVICDLYEEEDIPLTLSIDNFKNVAEKVQSYSKDFSLPATKRNNQIFNNMFEITRADDKLIFNPYRQTKCVLKQDGFILFEGFLRMIDIKDKEGEISYSVNLYSDVIALADILKDKTFADLDISELTSDYTITNIKASWDGGLVLESALTDPNEFAGLVGATTTDVMKYPFIDWNHQFFLDTDFNPEMPNLNSAFRPCISIKYLISKIFAEAGFNWTSNFFDSTDFGKLYMDFNWGNDENPTDVHSWGWGRVKRDSPFADNFAPNGTWGEALLQYEQFPTEQGYATGIFTIPAGQDNTTFTVNYTFDFLFLNYDDPATLILRWFVDPVVGNAYSINAVTSIDSTTVTGSAVAYADVDDSGNGTVSSVDVEHGGYYDAVPDITFTHVATSSSGSGATATAVLSGGTFGTVTEVNVTDGGSGYDQSSCPFVSFNGVGPNQSRYTYTGDFVWTLQAGDTLQLQMSSDVADAVLQDHRKNPNTFYHLYQHTTAYLIVQSTVNTMAAPALLNALRGEVGQWDFLKGIMTMFNLVTMVDDTNKNNILIEPYSDVFIDNTRSLDINDLSLSSRFNGKIHDWTDKVDVSQMELKPLTDLNKNTVFKFVEDDDDYCFNAYKMATSGGLYGAKYFDASGFTILEGEEEIIAEPFAATVMKPLQDFFPDFIVPSIYSVDDSGESDGFDNSPRLLYDNGIQTLTSCTYTIPDQNNTAGIDDEDEFLQFSHLSSIPIDPQTTVDFNFESQQLIQPLDINGMPADNLYSTYWQPYFNELYNADTRIMILKVNLSPSDIATFKFYDKVMIKNRSFRVNKIEYKPNSLAKVEFILIP